MHGSRSSESASEPASNKKLVTLPYKRVESGPEEPVLWAYFGHYSLAPEVGSKFFVLERRPDGKRTGRSMLCKSIEIQCAESTQGWDTIVSLKQSNPIVGIVFAIIEV